VLSKWIPTSKFCSNCGTVLDLSLYDRNFNCSCGEHSDRDVHAAKNMLWFEENIIGVGRTDYKPDKFKENLNSFFIAQEAAKSLA
jgi:transposase